MAAITEGIPIGQKFTSAGRTISEGDFSLLTNLTWTTSEIHANKEYMKSTQFGDRILAGPCILSCVIGLAGTSGFRQKLQQSGVRIVALLGFEDVRFKAPVMPGDTITAETEILDARASSSPKRGVMRVKDVAFKQSGEVVMESVRGVLFERTG